MSYKDIASISPYFDDYDPSKAYYSMLFNPGRAVQARELTQIQTLLQNQIESVSNHFFKDNSIIVNANVEHSFDKRYIQIEDNSGDFPASQQLQTFFLNKTLSDGTTVARVTHIDQVNFRLYFNYISGPGFNDATAITLKGQISDGTDDVRIVANSLSFATTAQCDSGIIYTGGRFVIVNSQEIIVAPNIDGHYHIGFIVNESVVTSGADSTLADPASGTNNAAQPGADRYKVDLVLSSYVEGDAKPTGFIEFLVVKESKIIKETTEVEYGPILDLLARRTYEESGNYTVDNFGLVLEEHESDSGKLSANMQPGTAYVLGYRIDKDLTTVVDIERSRDTRTSSANGVFSEYGQYVIIATNDGTTNNTFDTLSSGGTAAMPDFSTAPIIDLMDGVNGSGNVVGTCRGVNLKRVGDELRLYVADIADAISQLGSVKSMKFDFTGSDKWYANMHRPKGFTEIFGSLTAPILEFEEYDVVKSLGDITYKYPRVFKGIVASAGGELVISGSAFDSFGGAEDVIAILERDGSTGANYQNLIISGAGSSSLTITNSVVGFVPGETYDIVLSVTKTPLTHRTKSLISDYNDVVNDLITVNSSDALDKEYLLSKEDGVTLKKIYQRSNFIGGDINNHDPNKIALFNSENVVDVTDEFIAAGGYFDNGQREFYYDKVRLSRVSSQAMVNLTSGSGNTQYYVVYDYYEHSSGITGKAFIPDSYPDFNIIPSYTTEDGAKTYNLTNSVDFRFKLSEINLIPEYAYQGTQLIADVEFYLSRIDKIHLSQEGEFGVKKGVSSLKPEAPNDVDNSITLYTIKLPAYTYNRDDVTINQVDHRRYTMRDIGELDMRLTAIEEYTALSLLEKSATDLVIQDANGLDRFKAGIFVDPFDSYDMHNLEDAEYNFVIDKSNGFGRGPFTSDYVDLTETGAAASTNVSINENTVTLAYTEATEPLAQNLAVSDFINVNPLLFHQWNGTVKLTPAVDQWIDVVELPPIIREDIRTTVLPPQRGFNGEWNFWRRRWFGTDRNVTRAPARQRTAAGTTSGTINRGATTSFTRLNIERIPPISLK